MNEVVDEWKNISVHMYKKKLIGILVRIKKQPERKKRILYLIFLISLLLDFYIVIFSLFLLIFEFQEIEFLIITICILIFFPFTNISDGPALKLTSAYNNLH